MPTIRGDKGDFIIIKGRAGIDYFDESGNQYFVDGEMVVSKDYDFAIYSDSLIDTSQNMLISEYKLSSKIIKRIEELCYKGKIRTRTFKDNK